MFAQAIESILAQQCTPAIVRSIENGADPTPLASAIADTGFHELMTPEDLGGGGASWSDLFEIVYLCGSHAVPLPLPQTLAARTLTTSPQHLPDGLITLAPSLARDADGSIQALQVPAAAVSDYVLAHDAEQLLLLPTREARRVRTGIHGCLIESLRWEPGAGVSVPTMLSGLVQFQAMGALLHAGLMAGAMKRSFDMTMRYANDRIQFGKSIGKFQAIQHQLSIMAEQLTAARIAASAAFATARGMPEISACAAAKARTSEAAQAIASIAHSVHGAIGVTAEYELQLFTRRLHEWRMAHGSEIYWNRVLGKIFLDSMVPTSADFARLVFH